MVNIQAGAPAGPLAGRKKEAGFPIVHVLAGGGSARANRHIAVGNSESIFLPGAWGSGNGCLSGCPAPSSHTNPTGSSKSHHVCFQLHQNKLGVQNNRRVAHSDGGGSPAHVPLAESGAAELHGDASSYTPRVWGPSHQEPNTHLCRLVALAFNVCVVPKNPNTPCAHQNSPTM